MKTIIYANVELTKDGFSAYIESKEGIVASIGETIEELRNNLKEAYELHIQDLANKDELKNAEIELSLDVRALFEMLKPINVSGFSSYSGLNRSLMGQYLTGKKKPSEKQSRRILEYIHKLGEQLVSIPY